MADTGDPFISEDELGTFEGWCRYQRFGETTTPEEMRSAWMEMQRDKQGVPPVGSMSLRTPLGNGEFRYAVAVQEDGVLWLALWIRRSAKGEFFVLYPRRDAKLDAHTSYHANGRYHSKSHDKVFGAARQLQPLSAAFRGIEFLGEFSGYGPKSVGAICEPADFTDVIRVPPGVLGSRHGVISVQLLETGFEPPRAQAGPLVIQRVFGDFAPQLAVSIYGSAHR